MLSRRFFSERISYLSDFIFGGSRVLFRDMYGFQKNFQVPAQRNHFVKNTVSFGFQKNATCFANVLRGTLTDIH